MHQLYALWRYLFWSQTLTGEITGRTIYMDGLTIRGDCNLTDCILIYYGWSGVDTSRAESFTLGEGTQIHFRGAAAKGIALHEYINSPD